MLLQLFEHLDWILVKGILEVFPVDLLVFELLLRVRVVAVDGRLLPFVLKKAITPQLTTVTPATSSRSLTLTH